MLIIIFKRLKSWGWGKPCKNYSRWIFCRDLAMDSRQFSAILGSSRKLQGEIPSGAHANIPHLWILPPILQLSAWKPPLQPFCKNHITVLWIMDFFILLCCLLSVVSPIGDVTLILVHKQGWFYKLGPGLLSNPPIAFECIALLLPSAMVFFHEM